MAYLMDDNAMRICIRPRPWHPEKEVPFLAAPVSTPFFLGGGNFASAPRKPAGGGALREIVAVIDNRQIDFDKPEEGAELRRGMGGAGRRYKNRRYVFDHVFRMDANQEEVYENTAKPLLDGVLSGYNATVFAYGATGCGKTHTISGSAADPGIIVLTMRDLFDRIEETKDKYITHLELSMVELYNEQIRDLLSDNFPVTPTGGLKLLENEKERVTIADVTIKQPKSVDEVLDLVILGNERRSTSSTNANNQSSRSHAVLQINVTRSNRVADVDMESETVLQDTSSATLSIVDLAGSERASATHNMGARMKEGAKINQSLLALSSCISALCSAQRSRSRPHVPYRNSKLTRLLKFSLGGNCRTVMIVCVSPSSREMEDTSNTLTWANKAKDVKMRVTRNVGGHEVSARQYLQKISELGQRITILETLLEKEKNSTESVSTSKLDEVRKRIAETVQPVSARIDGSLPDIREGAETRARWDGAHLGIESMKARRDELSPSSVTEREFCDQIIRWYEDSYPNNRAAANRVGREKEATTSITYSLRSAEEKKIAGMDATSAHNLQLQVESERHRLDAAVAKAREAGYRASLACSLESLANCAVAFVSMKAAFGTFRDGFEKNTARGSASVPDLERLMDAFELRVNDAKDEVADTFKKMTRTDAIPKSPIRPATELLAMTAAVPFIPPAEPAVASPKSPAVKRVLAASEKKGGYVVGHGSPRRVAPKKSLRFADESQLEDVRIFRPGSSQGIIDIGEVLDIDDWDDDEMKDDVKPLPVSALRSAVRAPPPPPPLPTSPEPFNPALPKTSAPPPPPTAPSAATTISLASISAADRDTMPAWKQNRMLLGKDSSGQGPSPSSSSNSLSDPSVSTPEQPPAPTGKTTPIGLGKPSRPSRPFSALSELHQIPTRTPLGSSTLLQPTAASAARAAAQNGGEKSPGMNASPLSQSTMEPRRLSVSRRERSKLHKSGVPYKRNTSLVPSPKGSPDTSISPRGGSSAPLNASTTRALSRPPARMRSSVMMDANSSMNSAGDSSMLSTMGLGRSLRHSVSIGTFANPGLRPRPSMQQLNSAPARPAWK